LEKRRKKLEAQQVRAERQADLCHRFHGFIATFEGVAVPAIQRHVSNAIAAREYQMCWRDLGTTAVSVGEVYEDRHRWAATIDTLKLQLQLTVPVSFNAEGTSGEIAFLCSFRTKVFRLPVFVALGDDTAQGYHGWIKNASFVWRGSSDTCRVAARIMAFLDGAKMPDEVRRMAEAPARRAAMIGTTVGAFMGLLGGFLLRGISAASGGLVIGSVVGYFVGGLLRAAVDSW
jgi:hypothetical protein